MARAKRPPMDWRGQIGMDVGEQRQRFELESSVQDRVRQALEAVGVRVERNNVGAIRKGHRFIRYGVLGKGAPDLFCFLRGGTVFFVETKRAKGGVITDEQADSIRDLIKETKTDANRFLKWAGVESIPDIPASKFNNAVAMLNAKKGKAS